MKVDPENLDPAILQNFDDITEAVVDSEKNYSLCFSEMFTFLSDRPL